MRLNNQEKKLKSRRQNRNLWEWIEIFRNLWRVVFTYVKLSIKFTNGIFSKRAIFVCLPRRKFTFLRGPLVFVLIISWIFSGWPQIWQKPAIPPEIENTQAAAGDLILLWDGDTIPSGWTCISCASGDPYYQVYPRGAATYGTATSGAATHSHTVSYVSCTGPSATAQYDAPGTASYSSATHIHNTISSQTVDSASNDPLYRSLKIIRYTGMPATLPAGVIGIFDTTSLPENWSAYSLQDTYFLKGDGVVATSGSNTHTHSVSVTTGGPDTTETAKAGAKAGESPTHTHTGSGTSASTDHQPPYLEVVFAQASVDTPIPPGLIALFDAAPPTDWTLVSGTGQPFNGVFLKGNSTAYGGTGGAETHTHANLDINLPATADTIATADTAPAEVGADIAHTHTFTVSFSTESHLPVYRNTVFAKRDLILTVATTGSQVANMNIPSTDNYVGGAFTFISDFSNN